MKAARFLETRSAAWDRLEALVAKAGAKGLASLAEDELHELTRLYPAAAVDVARARLYAMDPKTQQRVNRLAIAAHGLLYRRRRGQPGRAVWRFLSLEYPRLFRRLWPYFALAATLFAVAGLGAYVCARLRPSAAYVLVPGAIEMPTTEPGTSREDISKRFRMFPKPPLAAAVTASNVSVAFTAFALGISAGVGTCYVVIMNAMMLGAFAAHFANHGLAYECWSFILPHGILEITAVLIGAAAGLRLGISLAVPGRLTRGASLRAGAREAVLLVLGTIPMFAAAGAVEGFVTPTELPGAAKIALGLALGATGWAYLLLAGRAAGKAQPAA